MALLDKAKANRVSALQLVERSKANVVTLRPSMHLLSGARSAARADFSVVA